VDRTFCVMTDRSQFDGNAPPARTRTGGFLVAFILGLILGGGLMALWETYGSTPLKQPRADIAANVSNETAQAIKDLQNTQQKVVDELEQQHQSVQQTLASEQAETKRLSEGVTALNGKLESLQQSFATVQRQPSPVSSVPPPASPKRRR
jgi:TolA-binding protein